VGGRRVGRRGKSEVESGKRRGGAWREKGAGEGEALR